MANEMPMMPFGHSHTDYHAPRELEYGLFPLAEVTPDKFVWLQPQLLRAAYELWAGDRVVATLRYRSFSHREALGATADGLWSFEEQDERGAGIAIHRNGELVGRVQRETVSRETIVIEGGFVFRSDRTDLVQTGWTLSDQHGQPILRFAPQTGPTSRTLVESTELALSLRILPLLLLTGQFLQLSRLLPRKGWLTGTPKKIIG